MVRHCDGNVLSQDIKEYQLHEFVSQWSEHRIPTKGAYELLRFNVNRELVIIYQDNRKLRTRNGWIETRAIYQLTKMYPEIVPIRRNVKFQMNGVETEVDGVGLDGTLIEIKNVEITEDHLRFYEKKRRALDESKSLILIGRKFTLKHPTTYPKITCLEFQPDMLSLKNFYMKDFTLPEAVSQTIQRRHVRFLMSNGHWKSQKSRFTKTAKWTPLEKFKRDVKSKFRKNVPIKIYWSLSEMTGPLDEFRGQGFPINRILAALDIDGSHEGSHLIENSPVCQLCTLDASNKLKIVKERLASLGHEGEYTVYSSGAKGYHLYFKDAEDGSSFVLLRREEMGKLVQSLLPYVDSFLSKTTGEFDMHRIFKIPYTIDASTGMKVSEHYWKLEFDDKLLRLSQ